MGDEATSWPGQGAVDGWLKEHGFYVSNEASMALKIAVTAERIRKQRALLEVRADADILRAETDAFRMCGMRIVGTPLMPEGYMALVSGNSATIIGPKGVWTITDDGFRVLAALADHDAGVK